MSFTELSTQLDPRPDIRGRQFERVCAWYLRNAPEYRRRFTQVWLWKDWPEAWAADAGIDLVAEERDGSLWAVQAKAYDDRYSITKRDVDSFLSESNRPQFAYRLLIATTDRIGATARRTLEGQTVPVGYLLRSQLEVARVEWPESLDRLRPRPPKPKKPFPHVREAIKATVKGFEHAHRGQLIMACGTGKTLVGLWSSERLESVRTLVLLPSLSLLAQTLREWTANATRPFDYLAVCSDETVVGEDEFVASTAELGVPVTTDADEISSFLRRRGRRVVFSTYQSSPQIAAAQKQRAPRFHLAIADEAHRCAGRVAGDFATIIDAGQIKSRWRLFMTATPRYYTPALRDEAGQLDVEIASMNDEAAFGPVFHRLTFGEAIERDLLSDYQVVVVGVDDETYGSWADNGEFVTRDGKKITDARTLAGQVGLAKAMRKYRLRRTISFHGRIKAASDFSSDMPDLIAWMPRSQRPGGKLWSRHVSGNMPSGQRDRLLRRFTSVGVGERNLLSNARCLAEGVDVPSIDGVAFIDPRRSTIDIIQAVGRAIRKAPDKKLGTIVMPVFIPSGEEAGQVLDGSAFKPVWDVLKALRAHDDVLGDELDALRRRLGARHSPPRRPGKIKLDVPATRVGAQFVRAFNARLVEQTTSSWEFWFGLLERFTEREGHARVPVGYREDGYALGRWINKQRTAFGKARLGTERERRLAALPGWTWDVNEAAWEEALARLLAYVESEGSARVSTAYKHDGFALGLWVSAQRTQFATGTLSRERQRRLAALPGWTWDALQIRWDEAFDRLVEYVTREGSARIAQDHVEDGFPLGRWVSKQRGAYSKGTLNPERQKRLAALPGWTWQPDQARWDEGFARLSAYVKREGSARVPGAYEKTGYRLGSWVIVQRSNFAKGKLDPGRERLLAALPGWIWNTSEATWEEAFERLCEYVEREGNALVPRKHVEDGFPLGDWVKGQRVEFGRGKLDPERERRLAALPGWTWDAREEAWNKAFDRLSEYVKREGDAFVSTGYVDDGFRLGQWVAVQRRNYAKGELGPEREERLAGLSGWAWDALDAKWEEGFRHLKKYVEREAHARVPGSHKEDGYRLGQWVGVQRGIYAEGKLEPDRAARLAALPGWTWDSSRSKWDEGFGLLLSFVEREGHARVPVDHFENGFPLGQWTRHYRSAFLATRRSGRSGRLTPDRQRQLEALPGWVWDLRTPARGARDNAQLNRLNG
jgi:superfamily II DNA or RNA helicase